MPISEKLQRIAAENGYLELKLLDGKVCGLLHFIYTTAIVVGVDEYSYDHRYCYPRYADAAEAFAVWDGAGDPPGNWIKRKGKGGDVANPKYAPND